MRERMWIAYAFMTPVVRRDRYRDYPLIGSILSSFRPGPIECGDGVATREHGAVRRPGQLRQRADERRIPRDATWTIVWTGVNVFLHFVIGLGLALLLNQRFRGRTAYRLVLMLPWAVPAFVSAVAWRYIFNGEYGFLNLFLENFGIDGPNWLSELRTPTSPRSSSTSGSACPSC